ncbi:MAG: amidohydrolase family protein, partial [Candidatus Omnitrophica bacterium]|nr:amidohydrolase family protein [Candidatus Omnitrophota bacterium]
MVVTTSGDYSIPSVLCAINTIGVDNVLFSVDWPDEYNKVAVDFLKHIPVDKPDLEKIAYKNAVRVLGLKNI